MREITFYYPSKSFPSLSVTGEACALECAHCEKKYLRNMIPATTPRDLVRKCFSLWQNGAEGVLISGGCDRDGKVPLFHDALSEIRRKTGLFVNLHTGFVDESDLPGLSHASPHCISFDIPTDYALKNIYGLARESEEYLRSFSLLKRHGFNAIPHLCLGLDESEEEDKMALRRVSVVSENVVLNIVVPTIGTDFEKRPVDQKRIIEEFAYARPLFKRITLGCMRPRRKRVEEEAVMFEGIVAPTRWARVRASSLGIAVKEKKTCCVVF